MDGKITITGDASSVLSMLQKSGDAIRGFQAHAEGSFGKFQSTLGAVQSKWMALGGVILAGAGFKEAIDTSVNLTKEATSLAKALGISTTEASVLNIALGDIYQSKDALIAANTRLVKTLGDNEEAFTKLGVKTRDQNGEYRNSLDIMLDVNKRLMDFKEGTDRNIEGMKIYGKQWGEVAGLLKLNAELMEESRKKAAALNMAVGEENVRSTAQYRAAMNDVDDVLTAVKKTIGDAVMPIFTDLGNMFADTGPQQVNIMRKAVSLLVVGVYGLKNSFEVAWIFIKAAIQGMVVSLLTLADTGVKALSLDFSGAKAAWKNGSEQLIDIATQAGADLLAVNEKNGAAITQALERGFGTPVVTPTKRSKGGTENSTGGAKDPEKTRTGEWDNVLDQQKQAHARMNTENGTFYEFSKMREADYWKSILARSDLTHKERYEVERKYTKLTLDIQKDQYDARIAGLKLEMEGFQNNMDERERIARTISEQVRQRFGTESKEYAQAQEEMTRIARKRAEQQKAIDNELREATRARQTAAVDAEEQEAQLMLSLGTVSREQLLTMEVDFENRRYNIKYQALQDQLALQAGSDADPVERSRINRQLEELEIQHQQKIGQIRNAKQLAGAQPQSAFFNSMESSLDAAMSSMLLKTQSWSQAMKSIYKTTGMAFIQELITKPLAQWIAMWVRKLAMSLGFLNTENAQQATAATTSQGIAIGKATTEIGVNAAVAGSGAAASQAGIPYVGPILAIAAMAAIFAAVMGMKSSVKSASKGFDIPKGMNPMTQLHEEEMVIPAQYANGLRDLINNGAAGQREGDTHLHLHALDGPSAKRFLMDNKGALADALKAAYRDGKR